MVKPLSEDLRVRVIEAVEGGTSRRQAAKRFGVSAASAVRWVSEWRLTGRTTPRAMGGDTRSRRIEAEADFLLAKVEETPDITLVELRETLLDERGLGVAESTVWRFFDRREITFKKRRVMRPSRSAPT